MSKSIEQIEREFRHNNDYKPFISSIVFPNYKNITPGAEVTFDFPLTLLIGRNGTNKSSILHAVYGCPEGKSTGVYWFSLHTDPIDADGNRAAFFYRYDIFETGSKAEVLKTRIKNKDDFDYWEPSRPVLSYGMQRMPTIPQNSPVPAGRSKTRWNAIEKEVLYLDFRAEISAFDKAFYKVERKESRPEYKKKLRRQSKPLKESIDNELQSRIYNQKQRIFVNHIFTEKQKEIVTKILGTEYKNITYIEHDFYYSKSFSVYLNKGGESSYSEAFAGSGETSVIRLVYALDNAQDKTLVLLDEPETSLHIEAQYRLRDYIMQVIDEKKLQVVISTHSPFFALNLPANAIKVLNVDEITKKIVVINSAPAQQSSFYLGYRKNEVNKVNVYVEDPLSEALILQVINSNLITPSERDQIVVHHYIGGNSQLLKMATSEMLKSQSNVAFIFDGDSGNLDNITDPETIAPADYPQLKAKLKQIFGSSIEFARDSNNSEQEIENYKNFLKFARERFRYLPFVYPEDFIVENHRDLALRADKQDAKQCIKNYTNEKLNLNGAVTAKEILFMQRQLLGEIPPTNASFVLIASFLKYFINSIEL